MTFKKIIYDDYSAENPFESFVQPVHINYDKDLADNNYIKIYEYRAGL